MYGGVACGVSVLCFPVLCFRRLSNRRGWVACEWEGRGSLVVGLRSPMYTRHCIYTFMLLAKAVLSAISF